MNEPLAEKETGETVDPYLWDRRYHVLYKVALSTLYHRKRERFYDTLDRATMVLAVFGGSVAFAEIAGEWMRWIGAAVAVASAFALIFAFAERARVHARFAEQFGEIGAHLASKGERT